MLKAGVGAVIPSEAEATLDIRAMPGEDIGEFYDAMQRVIGDPAVRSFPFAPHVKRRRRASIRTCFTPRVSGETDVSRIGGAPRDVHVRFRHGATARRYPVLRRRASGDGRGSPAVRRTATSNDCRKRHLGFIEFAWNAVAEIAVKRW